MTTTTTSGSFTAQLELAAPPQTVFEALTTLAGIEGWWTPRVTGRASAGGELRLGFPNSDGPTVVLGVEAERPRRVTWKVLDVPALPAWAEWAGTSITFELRPAPGGGTSIGFRHEGLTPRLDCYDVCSGGWRHGLTSLQRHVDGPGGLPFA